MGLITGASALRAVLSYGQLPASGNAGDIILVASLGAVASWTGSAWVLDPVTTANSLVALGAAPTITGVDGMGSNAAQLTGTQTALNAIYVRLDAILAAIQI